MAQVLIVEDELLIADDLGQLDVRYPNRGTAIPD